MIPTSINAAMCYGEETTKCMKDRLGGMKSEGNISGSGKKMGNRESVFSQLMAFLPVERARTNGRTDGCCMGPMKH